MRALLGLLGLALGLVLWVWLASIVWGLVRQFRNRPGAMGLIYLGAAAGNFIVAIVSNFLAKTTEVGFFTVAARLLMFGAFILLGGAYVMALLWVVESERQYRRS